LTAYLDQLSILVPLDLGIVVVDEAFEHAFLLALDPVLLLQFLGEEILWGLLWNTEIIHR